MKKTIFTTIVLALITSASAFAQKPDVTENFDINGIKIESVVNDTIIKSKLGTPTREGFLDGMMGYWFEKTFIGIGIDDGKVYEIFVRDSKFPVMTDIFEGGIRVGDNASEVKAKIREKTRNEIHENDKGFIVGSHDYHIDFGVANGKITLISFGTESI